MPLTSSQHSLLWKRFLTSLRFKCLVLKMEIITVPICYPCCGRKWNGACDALGRVPGTLKALDRNRRVPWKGPGFEVNWLPSAICWLCDLGWILMVCVVSVFICKTRVIIHLTWACLWTFRMFVLSESGHTCFLAVPSQVARDLSQWMLGTCAVLSSLCLLLLFPSCMWEIGILFQVTRLALWGADLLLSEECMRRKIRCPCS